MELKIQLMYVYHLAEEFYIFKVENFDSHPKSGHAPDMVKEVPDSDIKVGLDSHMFIH